ncbi:MAG: SLC13 family permease, partial [Nitrospinota bacterium]|nr:SLC13 family permease [Nitrospinota bacterium]
LLFGGGFALAKGFEVSGLSVWVGSNLEFVSSFHPVLVLVIICLFSTFLTEFTSNTATAQIMLPILASLAVAAGFNPLFIMIPATFSFSFAFMLPVATPPNAIVFGAGRLRIVDMAKAGLAMNLIGVIVVVLAAIFIMPLALDMGSGAMPDWVAK